MSRAQLALQVVPRRSRRDSGGREAVDCCYSFGALRCRRRSRRDSGGREAVSIGFKERFKRRLPQSPRFRGA